MSEFGLKYWLAATVLSSGIVAGAIQHGRSQEFPPNIDFYIAPEGGLIISHPEALEYAQDVYQRHHLSGLKKYSASETYDIEQYKLIHSLSEDNEGNFDFFKPDAAVQLGDKEINYIGECDVVSSTYKISNFDFTNINTTLNHLIGSKTVNRIIVNEYFCFESNDVIPDHRKEITFYTEETISISMNIKYWKGNSNTPTHIFSSPSIGVDITDFIVPELNLYNFQN